jgi:hypothetical protein
VVPAIGVTARSIAWPMRSISCQIRADDLGRDRGA